MTGPQVPTAPGAAIPTAGAQVILIPPPLYYGIAFAVGVVIQQIVPLDIPALPATTPIGLTVLIAGSALCVAAVVAVVRHHTTIVPHHPVSALLTGGAYRVSRNPMYTGLALIVGGGSLIAGTWWPLILLPVALTAVRRLVIDPEERYLTTRFGPSYTTYRATVRRWL